MRSSLSLPRLALSSIWNEALVASALATHCSGRLWTCWQGRRSATSAALLTATLLASCGGGDHRGSATGVVPPSTVGTAPTAPPTATYAIGGTVSGLAAPGLVLQNNAGDDLAIAADGAFRFTTPVASGARYQVTVFAQPAGQLCAVVNDRGQADAPMSDVAVSCQGVAVPVPASAPADLAVGYAAQRYDFSWSPVAGASYYQLQEDPDGAGAANASQVGANVGVTALQYTVALHLRLNASYTVRACNASGCGPASAALVPDPVKAIGHVKASNASVDDLFGISMTLSGDGTTLAVGAPQEESNATGIGGDQSNDSARGAGAVYVYTRVNGAWVQQAYVKASNTDAGDNFGMSVALSADGATLAVSAPAEDSSAYGIDVGQADNSATDTGAVYVYTRRNGAWAQQAYVKGARTAGGHFGNSVALSADGATLAVGADSESSGATGVDGDQLNNSAPYAGAVYLYTRSNGTWVQQAYVKASNTDAGDHFGLSLALSADGATLAVGAPFEDSGTSGVKPGGYADPDNSRPLAGAVYMYVRTNGTWTQQAYVKAFNPASAIFGVSVALSADGTMLAVAAPGEFSSATGIDGNQGNTSVRPGGTVYVYSRTDGSWAQQGHVKPPATSAEQCFGMGGVALSADGATLAVGENCARAGSLTFRLPGAAYVYTRTSGAWAQQARLEGPDASTGSAGFAVSLALSADGGTLAVSQPAEPNSGNTAGGGYPVHLY
ncbi:hypothetical protein D3C85_485150 [compost metagenome]